MTCPRCGNANPAGARFCNECGAPLAKSREERRLATVLFADVAASTELATQLDPEALRALLGRFYELARSAVGAHGGTLVRGDRRRRA